MSDHGDGVKYKWTPESTALLVSVWSDKQVQKQLEYASKPQNVWDSMAWYMKKKGYNVSWKQCRSRMKQVLVCYREAKRAGTRAGVEQYYESIDRVLKNKRAEENMNGVDTVDGTINVKSPPKDVKTNKNLQMRQKFQEPVQSLYRMEALSPTWPVGRENEYPDSPESNETIIARPYNVFSPTRDIGINTGEQLACLAGKSVQCNSVPMEEPVHINYKQNLLSSYPYGEVPYQNTVQNVQNQIIQENMQQYQHLQQNSLWNNPNTMTRNSGFQHNLQNSNQGIATQAANVPMQTNVMSMQNQNFENIMQQRNPNFENIMQQQNPNFENRMQQQNPNFVDRMQQQSRNFENTIHQNQLQQMVSANNRAMPQEPQKIVFGQNLAATYKQHRDVLVHRPTITGIKKTGSLSPDYSPDVSQNLNDAFCQSTKTENKSHDLNETYSKPTQMSNPSMIPNPNISVITNNATCNDESLILEYLLDSPTPSENDNKLRDTAVNTENAPHIPLRKKKAQKLEQLVLTAINTQNEVVNKILSAQNDMVSRFLDVDRDRQNRLENRLDDLLKVVHASVLNKPSSETEDAVCTPTPEPIISSLVPPPMPGVLPPKLDLVPPKPCRVPCTVPSSNIQLINQNPVPTRPGVVSPITSPTRKPGTIWTKLGPVSQSPFVKAQQRLGFQPVIATETRTQSSAERRIAKEVERCSMDHGALIFETTKFIEMEKELEERIENARLEMTIGQTLNARRKLFTQREPSAAMILTTAFLDNERRMAEQQMDYYNASNFRNRNLKAEEDDLLAGQGESYERLRQLNVQPTHLPEPCNTSTPAKMGINCNINNHNVNNNERTSEGAPKQTIQQLAQLVMNTGRWRDNAMQQQRQSLTRPIESNLQKPRNSGYDGAFAAPRSTVAPNHQTEREVNETNDQKQAQERMSIQCGNFANEQRAVYRSLYNNGAPPKPKFPMGFTATMLDNDNTKGKEIIQKECNGDVRKSVGFSNNVLPDRKQNVRFMDEALAELHRMYLERVSAEQQEINDSLPYVVGNGDNISVQNRQMIDKYTHEVMPRKQFRDGKGKDIDSDNDEEFLDTTATMPTAVVARRGSLTSTGTTSTETTHSLKFSKPDNCVIC